jgi:hypothetical protein
VHAAINTQTKIRPPVAPSGQTGGLHSWLKLLGGLALVLLFMYVIAPLGKHLPGFDSMFQFIDQKGLRATALYYTDIDEFGEAAVTLRNNREYTPKGP